MAFDPFTIGLTVLGGIFGSKSSSKAAEANEAAQREALELQKYMFEQSRADYQPWLKAGVPALNEMMRMVGLAPMAGLSQTVNPTPTGGTGSGTIGPDTASPVSPYGAGGGGIGGTPGGSTLPAQTANPTDMASRRTIADVLAGRPTPMPAYSTPPLPLGVNSDLSGNLFPGRPPEVAIYDALAPRLGGEVAPTSPTPATLNDPLNTIMGNVRRPDSPYGGTVNAMGSYMSPAGGVQGVLYQRGGDASMMPSDPGVYLPPAMQAAMQNYREEAAVTPRATGGPMIPGNTYSVAELEPEMVSTPMGSTMVTQPTVINPSVPMNVTPGPTGSLLNTLTTPPPETTTPAPSVQTAVQPYQFMTDDPGYQFRVGEGQRALERSAAARGGLLSGGTGRALTRYGQDYGSQEYMNRFNRLASIAGMGQAMTSNSAQLGMGYGGNMANLIGGMGASRASGYLGQGSAMSGSLQNLAFLRALGGG